MTARSQMKLRLTPLSRIAAATRYARSFGAVFFDALFGASFFFFFGAVFLFGAFFGAALFTA